MVGRTLSSYIYQIHPEARYLTLPLVCVLHVLAVNCSYINPGYMQRIRIDGPTEAEHIFPAGAFIVRSCETILLTVVVNLEIQHQTTTRSIHSNSAYAWLTEFVNSTDVVTSAPTSRTSGILNVAATLTDTPTDDDSGTKSASEVRDRKQVGDTTYSSRSR